MPSSPPVVALAEEEARVLGSAVVGPEHLLLALCRDDGAAGSALAAAGVRRSLLLERLPQAEPYVGHLELDAGASRAIARSLRRTADLDHREVLRPHLLVALLDELGGLLDDLGVDVPALRADVLARAGHDDLAGEMERIVYRNASPLKAGDLLRQLRDVEKRLDDLERRLGD